MTINEEIKVVINQLPTQKAFSLSVLLSQFENVRRGKYIKEYAETLNDFEKSKSIASWN